MAVEIGQGVAKCAEHKSLVIGQLVLVEQNLDEGLDLGIVRAEVARLVEQAFDFTPDLIEKAEIGVVIAVACFEQFETVKLELRMSDRNGARP